MTGTWSWDGENARPLCVEAVVGTPPCVPVNTETYTNWHQGEPNNALTGEDSCQFYYQSGTWNDRAHRCANQRGLA